MASFKYFLANDKVNTSIYIRLVVGRKIQLKRKTGLIVQDPKKDWSESKQAFRNTNASNKKLNSTLLKLQGFILSELNTDMNDDVKDSVTINGQWLKDKIDIFFKRKEVMDTDYLVNYGQMFCEDLVNRTYMRKGIQYKYHPKTISKYNNILRQLQNFETYSKKKYKLVEIDTGFIKKFEDYLISERNTAKNTRGQDIKKLKTILIDAEAKGKKMNPDYKKIRGYSDERITTTLTFEEIDIIKNAKLKRNDHIIARDWLIIGCLTGQRISDLFRMNKRMIIKEFENGETERYIKLRQYKTKKQVKVPIDIDVEKILKKYGDDFPPNFYENEKSNRTHLNKLMKEVCEEAEINEMVKGRYNGKEGIYPKYKLITNHTCRRSFASNLYGTPFFTTPQLMEITGHSNEKNFLLYIGEDQHKFSKQNAKSFKLLREELERQKREKDSKLQVI